jgi:hypothetical protein
MSVNGESEAGIARDGDKAESVTIITAHEKSQSQKVRPELTVCLAGHSLWQEGHRMDHQHSDPYH